MRVEMSTKIIISVIIISIFMTNAREIQDLEEADPEKSIIDNEVIDETIAPITSTTTTTSTSQSSQTYKSQRDIKICTDLTPNFMSTRSAVYQTLDCSVKICDDPDYDTDRTLAFNQPLFDWNSGFGHIFLGNGSCDYERGHCWHSIDIDLRYFSHQMLDNGITELQFSCSVSDSFTDTNGNGIGWGFGSDISTLKQFRGRAVDESCGNDIQCGDHMFCLNSGRDEGTVCQCSVDFLTGVQFVQVFDKNYKEWICLPPLMINESCSYDQQCQAMDPNSICSPSPSFDSSSQPNGKCQCIEGMVWSKSSCSVITTESTPRPAIVWWIFTEERGSDTSHRFWWLRAASYLIAVIAIILPIAFIFIALFVLCYKRVAKNHLNASQTPIRPTFPAPKIVINDFIRKEKSDDKYGLVKNDHLSEA